jgi:hypothetical protein
VLRDEEVMRMREAEVKKSMEMELYLLKQEKDKIEKTSREYELKIRDLETHKAKLEKEHIEEIERFKANLQVSFKDQDFDIHRRRLQLEEDEARVNYERERL